MASADTLRILRELQSRPDNKVCDRSSRWDAVERHRSSWFSASDSDLHVLYAQVCVDCNGKNPQWATVSYGTFMCLECSGKHRGLGVHISFVR